MASRTYARRARRRKTKRLRRKQKGGAQVTYRTPDDSGITVFTSADRMEPTLQALLDSLKTHKYSYEVLGFGKPWTGYKTKIQNYVDGIKRYVAEKGPNALAIFVDAFDVICIKDSDKLLATYKEKPRKMPVVFGGEIACFNNCYKDVLNWYDKHSVLGGRATIEGGLKSVNSGKGSMSEQPIYMNTGFIMGPASELEFVFTGISQIPENEQSTDGKQGALPYTEGKWDDQYMAGKWAAQNLDRFDINVEETMIRNKLIPREKLPDEDGQQGPAFLHFPGSRWPEQQKENVNRYANYKKN